MIFGRSKDIVGLDIGDSSIKVVELKQLGRGRGWEVVSLANEPLPQEAIVDGTIMDAGLVVDTLRRIWEQNRIRTRRVAMALSGQSVIIRRINLPQMSEQELAEQIKWEAEQYIPFNIQEVAIDYHLIDGPSLAGEGNMDVILVAARKEKIDDYVSVISQAGLEPALVDVGSFAALKCLTENYTDEMPASAALIDIGASVTSIAVLHHGQAVFWRDISIGGNQYTDTLQRELNLSREQAEAAKRREPVEGVSGDQVAEILSSVNEELCHEIQRTIDFVKAFAGSEQPLETILLTGGGSKLPGLPDVLSESFGARVEMLDAFRRVRLPARFEAEFGDAGPNIAVAAGLAMRRAGDGGINLLEVQEEGRPAGTGIGTSFAAVASPAAVASLVLVGLTVGWLGWQWWARSSKIEELQAELKRTNEEVLQLKKALEKVDEFESKKAALEQRVQIISDLKRRQVVPVYLLDQVSRELPDFLWLDKLAESGGSLRISGKATTYNAVSNFYNNLRDSPFFEGVTLGTTRRVPEGVSFQLSCQFTGPTPGTAAAAGGSTVARAE